jgi:hypothetical protein
MLNFGQHVRSLPREQQEFIYNFKHDKPGWMSQFIDGVEWKLQIVSDKDDVSMKLWKDDEPVLTEQLTCHISCMLVHFHDAVWQHYQAMQSIAAAKPNPKSPWAR